MQFMQNATGNAHIMIFTTEEIERLAAYLGFVADDDVVNDFLLHTEELYPENVTDIVDWECDEDGTPTLFLYEDSSEE